MNPWDPIGHVPGYHTPGTTVPIGYIVEQGSQPRCHTPAPPDPYAHPARMKWIDVVTAELADRPDEERYVRLTAQWDKHARPFEVPDIAASVVGRWFADSMSSTAGTIDCTYDLETPDPTFRRRGEATHGDRARMVVPERLELPVPRVRRVVSAEPDRHCQRCDAHHWLAS